MIHNASLGSSLRWMYEEGSIDAEIWEKYSASPGALLPIRPGVERPTPVMPAPLANAFFQIVQEAKGDMEYLAGIYSSMMGDSGGSTDNKTKNLKAMLTKLELPEKVLIVADEVSENLRLASRNLPDVHVLSFRSLNVYEMMKYTKVVFLKDALEAYKERLGR